jgi:hypothetical protein
MLIDEDIRYAVNHRRCRTNGWSRRSGDLENQGIMQQIEILKRPLRLAVPINGEGGVLAESRELESKSGYVGG